MARLKVALVKLSSIGDVVHALPVAAALRAHRSDAQIVWIVERREAAILRGHPALDAIEPVDTRAWRCAHGPAAAMAAARAVLVLRRRLRAAAFDVALDLQGLLKSGLLVAGSRAPLRIGFAPGACREPLSALFTNHRVRPPTEARHVVEQYLSLLGPLGVRAPRAEFRLPADAAAEARIDDFIGASGLKPRDRLVVVNPGAGRPDKRWPAGRFRELAARVAEELGAAVLVVWGPAELATATEIVGAGRPRVVLAPPTDLDGLLAVLRRASVVVGGDTGPLHMAAALGTPCVGLYGPTSAQRNGPYGSGHRTLASPDGTLAGIPVESALRAVGDLLA